MTTWQGVDWAQRYKHASLVKPCPASFSAAVFCKPRP
jgi:hypothetical protein